MCGAAADNSSREGQVEWYEPEREMGFIIHYQSCQDSGNGHAMDV